MKIGVIGSMHLTEQMIAVRDALVKLGHDAFVTDLASPFIGKSDEEKEFIKIKQKHEDDAIREFWRVMQGADAVFVVNLERKGIPGYIGGNTFLEIGFAHVLNQRIFLYNDVPEIPYYKSEIEAMAPIVVHGDFRKVV